MSRRKSIPAGERWSRDRNRTGYLLGVLPHLIKTCPWYDLERVVDDMENWQLELDRARRALTQRHKDDATRRKIDALRNKTEANGCSQGRRARRQAARLVFVTSTPPQGGPRNAPHHARRSHPLRHSRHAGSGGFAPGTAA